jgi:hypothetical protein
VYPLVLAVRVGPLSLSALGILPAHRSFPTSLPGLKDGKVDPELGELDRRAGRTLFRTRTWRLVSTPPGGGVAHSDDETARVTARAPMPGP